MKRTALPWLRLVLTLGGVAAASALTWFVGPLVAIGGAVPLAGEPARWAAIAVVVALAAAHALWGMVRASRRNRRLLDGLVAGADTARAPGEAEVAEVSHRFEQAISLLRRSRLGGAKRIPPRDASEPGQGSDAIPRAREGALPDQSRAASAGQGATSALASQLHSFTFV